LAKRENRVKPLEHETRQLENLKSLEPITTPLALRPLSDALIDLAIAALGEVSALESGEEASAERLQKLQQMANNLSVGEVME
jgi:hypothetical protein